MKQDIVLIGSGGCMREILWQIEELNQSRESNKEQERQTGQKESSKEQERQTGQSEWNVLGYVDIAPCMQQGSSDIVSGNLRCPYLGDDDYLLARQQETNVAVCVGEPGLRKKIAEKLMRNPNIKFPNLILSDVRICPDVKMGQGCIISMDSRISTNVKIGDFVFLNIGAVVCHDGTIGDFTTLSPDVKLAGQVTIGSHSDIGLGTRIIQGITVGSHVITGAGSVIIRDVEDNCTVVGVPARRIG